jgi:hypothetical protein
MLFFMLHYPAGDISLVTLMERNGKVLGGDSGFAESPQHQWLLN